MPSLLSEEVQWFNILLICCCVWHQWYRVGQGSNHFTPGIRGGVATQHPVDGLQQRVLLTAARVGEIIQIQGPDHATPKPVVNDPLRLSTDHVDVVIADPLVALVRIRSHPGHRVLNNSPSLALDTFTDFIVGQKSSGSCEFTGLATPLGWRI